jgi:CPA1 family monovalent cation:H+ antiporter
METSNQILEILILILFIATLVSLVTRRLRLPYTVGLVLMGLFLGIINQPGVQELPESIGTLINLVENQITPGIIVGVLVTPLIFEAAFHLRWESLRRDLGLILALAIPGVILTTLLVGGIIFAGTNYTLPMAMLFGALMAATDPVSVIAVFRSLGVPKRLQILMEGESLFNDGTAIVIFDLVLAIALGASQAQGQGNAGWLYYLTDFVRVAGGGLVTGLVLGWIVSQVISKIDDHLIETTLTSVLAFGAYLAAEQLHVSGVLAVVAAGLVNGNIGPRGMSPTTRIVVANFWEYVAFISNSFVFLLIGLEMELSQLIAQWQPILLAILAVLLARAVVVYGLTITSRDIPGRWSHVLLWGGLRGAISLALALSLSPALGLSEVTQLRTMAFGVVLFTILVQGFTMQPLVKTMNLVQRSEMQEEYERRHARAVAARSAYERLELMHDEGLFSNHTWRLLSPLLKQHSKALAGSVREVLEADPSVEAEELDTARREALRAQRSALIDLMRDGVVSEDVYAQLAREVDLAITENQNSWAGLLKPARLHPVQKLMTAVIQIQDFENAVNALNEAGLSLTHMSSSGGFLGRRNITLLIGLGEGQEELAVRSLGKSCRRRVEYVATPLEGAPFHLPLSTPVTVGGATIFTIDVERYEEI